MLFSEDQEASVIYLLGYSWLLFFNNFESLWNLQTCFDILFLEPGVENVVTNGIKDVIMSTAWIDELPFLTGNSNF